MQPRPAAVDAATWRPQSFGRSSVKKIVDPIIEPQWEGDRVLVRVALGEVPTVDFSGEDGSPIVDETGLGAAIIAAARSSSLVLDGYLTVQATRSTEGLDVAGPHAPSVSEMTTQLLLGAGGRRRRQELADSRERQEAAGPLAFVAVDLLAVDDDPILDAPLLERKRILEGVLLESELVRLTAFVRPPVDPWLGTWRGIGFRTLAYKAANGRYVPGAKNPGWATAAIPQR